MNKTFAAVHALLIVNDSILILKRSRHCNYRPNVWDLPGGTVEFGEVAEAALKRELYEETGLLVNVLDPVFVYSNNLEIPIRQTFQIIFRCELIGNNNLLLNNEHSEFKWIKFNELSNYDCIEFLDCLRCNYNFSIVM